MEVSKLITAQWVSGFSIRLGFADNTEAVVNFEPELSGGVFEKLKDPTYFQSFKLNAQFGTIEWRNGADFSPEFLYELARKAKLGQSRARSDSSTRKSA